MPLSNANKVDLQEQQKFDDDTNFKKRKARENISPQNQKRLRETPDDSSMTDSQKRANFSALSSPNNGLNRHASPLANSKPGAAKKIVIKNFKGWKLLYYIHYFGVIFQNTF